ncbi:polysaccharide chain length determinant protein [Geomonas silvestris]|uniref:Polysaccharide chain length determinant protein n=1 Tax=Geomonas silvestris TaxID=2740184 RepID=A0A6V8MHD1_9BACT|nr:Wzz/FepE/Etk N-terminal domain-containing protein [Geomonas silvestris]GFO59401.1 polysaccharide chain length determinant protein [Geomonas silvestris]
MERKVTDNPDAVNLLDYLEVMAKHWRMIAKVSAATFVVSLAVSFMLPKIYSSTAMILPPQQDGSLVGMMNAMSGGMASLAGDLLGKGTTADLYVGMLNSREIQDKVIDRFKLMQVYDKDNRFDTYKELDKNTDIAAGKKDGIISITVEDKNPKLAADMANAFADELGRLTVRLNLTSAGQNRSYLEERLAKTKQDLSKAEDALKQFQSKNKVLDVPEQAKVSILGVADLKAQLAVQEVQLAGVRSRLTDTSPEVQGLQASMAKLRAQIARIEGSDKQGAIPSVGSVPQLGQEYVRLMREFRVQEAVFELLTKQYEMAKFSEGNKNDGVQVIQTATVPDKKVKPKRILIVLGATVVMGVLATLYAFLCESKERMSEEDSERWKLIRNMLKLKPLHTAKR